MPNLLGLTREQLASFLPDHQSIRAFEKMLEDIGSATPTSIEQANNNANTAIAMAGAALAALAELGSTLEQLASAPVQEITFDTEDYARVVYVGSLGFQNDDEVDISGGSINGVSMGATTPSSGAFTSLSYSQQLTSTVASGTAPMVVASTTKVSNLNVDLLDGADWAAPAAIGSTTPNAGTFTNLTVNGNSTLIGNTTIGNNTIVSLLIKGSNSGSAGGGSFFVQNSGVGIIGMGNKSAVNGGAYDATPLIYGNATIEVNNSLKVPGGAVFLLTSGALTNGAGAAAGTLTNAPTAGNPTKWIGINDNGTVRYIPAW